MVSLDWVLKILDGNLVILHRMFLILVIWDRILVILDVIFVILDRILMILDRIVVILEILNGILVIFQFTDATIHQVPKFSNAHPGPRFQTASPTIVLAPRAENSMTLRLGPAECTERLNKPLRPPPQSNMAVFQHGE